jgi:hypothetical protein
MFLQALLKLAAKRRPLHSARRGAVASGRRESRRDVMLGEVYCAHARSHGRNELLPKDVLPTCPNVHGQVPPVAKADRTCGPYSGVH